MDEHLKEVLFWKYCQSCKHKEKTEEQEPCCNCLNEPGNIDSHKPIFYERNDSIQSDETVVYNMPEYRDEYLYFMQYEKYDYDYAERYFKSRGDLVIPPTGCSVVKNGPYIGRQLDWYYNNDAEFIVKTRNTKNRFATLGVCGGLSELSRDFVRHQAYSELYKIVPFHMYDGINQYGLFANINVVPNDKGNNVANARILEKRKLSALMLIRFVLDKFRSANEAVYYIRDYCTVYFPKALHDMNFESHFMIADKNSAYVLEFVNNHTEIINMPIMTNFHLFGVTFNPDGTVETPETGNAILTNGITPHGSGLERFNLIVNNYDSCNSAGGMREMCNKLMYSKTYLTAPEIANPFWYSEYVGGNNRLDSPVEQLRATAERIAPDYTNRVRGDNKTWHSTHSVVYDLNNLTMDIITQENGKRMRFCLR